MERAVTSFQRKGSTNCSDALNPRQEMPVHQLNKEANGRSNTAPAQPRPCEQGRSQYARSTSPGSTPISGQKGSVNLWNYPAQCPYPPSLTLWCQPTSPPPRNCFQRPGQLRLPDMPHSGPSLLSFMLLTLVSPVLVLLLASITLHRPSVHTPGTRGPGQTPVSRE